MTIGERLSGWRFLIGDRDTKFSAVFNEVFTSEGLPVLRTPVRAPKRTPTQKVGSVPSGENASLGS